jgi:hypothetical protein
MYQNWVPLRGHRNDTAEDTFEYRHNPSIF